MLLWIGVPEEKEKVKGSEEIFEEIILEKFPNMGKEIINVNKFRESHTGYPKGNLLRNILIKQKRIKCNEKNIKSTKGKATNNIEGNVHKVIS